MSEMGAPEFVTLPDPNGGCCCTPFSQSAGGVYVEHLAEYEPACPVHSEHLYDPTTGVWVLRDDLVAKAKADGVREAADNMYLTRPGQHNEAAAMWLRRRADLIDPRTRAEAHAQELLVESLRDGQPS